MTLTIDEAFAEIARLKRIELAALEWARLRRRETQAAALGSGRHGSGSGSGGPPPVRAEIVAAERALLEVLR